MYPFLCINIGNKWKSAINLISGVFIIKGNHAKHINIVAKQYLLLHLCVDLFSESRHTTYFYFKKIHSFCCIISFAITFFVLQTNYHFNVAENYSFYSASWDCFWHFEKKEQKFSNYQKFCVFFIILCIYNCSF